jgi:hypothetical protein
MFIIEPIYPVVEVFYQNHYEPWAIIVKDSKKTYKKVIDDAQWKLCPINFREGTTADWGGLNNCLKRMNKVFSCHNN